jgi:pilus assembly protein Flp/PilA
MRFFRRLLRCRKGAAMVEYGLLVAGVALMSTAAVAIFGHKTNDMVAAMAAVLPGAHADDNAPIISGKIIETTAGTATDPIAVDIATIVTNSGSARLGNNMGVALDTLVVEP